MGNFLTGMSLTNGITMTVAPPTPQQAFFFGGAPYSGVNQNTINLISSTGVVATATSTSATARTLSSGATYGGDKAVIQFGFAYIAPAQNYYNITNLVSNTGTVASDTPTVATGRRYSAGAGYGSTGQAIFAYGMITGAVATSLSNLLSNTGVIASNVTGVGTVRNGLAAATYGSDKALFGYGINADIGGTYSLTNLVSNTGVIATDTTGVGTARYYLAAAGYGGDKAIFGFGVGPSPAYSLTNLVSNAGVVATDTTGVGTARFNVAAAGYGGDKAIFGGGQLGAPAVTTTNIINLVSNTGVVATDTTGNAPNYSGQAAASFSYT